MAPKVGVVVRPERLDLFSQLNIERVRYHPVLPPVVPPPGCPPMVRSFLRLLMLFSFCYSTARRSTISEVYSGIPSCNFTVTMLS